MDVRIKQFETELGTLNSLLSGKNLNQQLGSKLIVGSIKENKAGR